MNEPIQLGLAEFIANCDISKIDEHFKADARLLGEDICRRVFFAFCREKLPLLQLNMVKASLEDIFLELTGGEVSADSSGADGTAEAEEEVEQP